MNHQPAMLESRSNSQHMPDFSGDGYWGILQLSSTLAATKTECPAAESLMTGRPCAVTEQSDLELNAPVL